MNVGDKMNKYYALNYISKIDKKYKKYIEDALKRDGSEKLAVSDGNVIAALYGSEDGLTMKEISKKVHRTKSTISQSVDKLEKNGFIIKYDSLEDKRSTIVKLTQDGLDLKPLFGKISDEIISRFFKGFTEEDIKRFMEYLEQINKNLSE